MERFSLASNLPAFPSRPHSPPARAPYEYSDESIGNESVVLFVRFFPSAEVTANELQRLSDREERRCNAYPLHGFILSDHAWIHAFGSGKAIPQSVTTHSFSICLNTNMKKMAAEDMFNDTLR